MNCKCTRFIPKKIISSKVITFNGIGQLLQHFKNRFLRKYTHNKIRRLSFRQLKTFFKVLASNLFSLLWRISLEEILLFPIRNTELTHLYIFKKIKLKNKGEFFLLLSFPEERVIRNNYRRLCFFHPPMDLDTNQIFMITQKTLLLLLNTHTAFRCGNASSAVDIR